MGLGRFRGQSELVRRVFGVNLDAGSREPLVYMCGLTKKKSFKQQVCRVELMQGCWVLYARPQRGGGEVRWGDGRWLFPEGFCRAGEVSGST